MPDGRIARFSVADDATPEQVTAEARKMGAGVQPKAKAQKYNNPFSNFNETLLGAGEGIYNAASAVTDPIARGVLSLFQGEDAADEEVAVANQGRRNVVDAAEKNFVPDPNPIIRGAARIGGTMAIPLPGKKLQTAGWLGKGAYRAVQGAVGGAGVREVDQSAAAPAAIGAAANVALGPVLSKAAPIIGRAAQRVAKPFLGRTPAQPTGPLAPLGRKAVARAARFKALGVDNPTTGMVTRNPAVYSFEQNNAKLAGSGEELAQQLREVETSLVHRGRKLVDEMGGAKGPEATGKAVDGVLDAKRAEMQQVTGRLYDKVRDTRGDEAVGDLAGFRTFLDDPEVVDDAVYDAMRESIGRRMARFDGPVTVNQAEGLRKFIGNLGSGIEPSVRRMRGMMIDALDDDVVSVLGDDAFKAARASAKARFGEFSKTFAGKLADEKLAPEVLSKRILGDGVKLSDLRSLRKSLSTGTPDQIARGTEAWRGLRAQGIEDLLAKSVDDDGMLVGSTLAREFSKAAPKFRELLDPGDYKVLRRLAGATRDAKAFPVGHSVNTSGTATTLANMFRNAPPAVQKSWNALLGRLGGGAVHAVAGATLGPAGNLAVAGVRAGASTAAAGQAEARAAAALMDKIRLARDPQAAAAAMQEAQAAASSSPAIADMLERAGLGRMIGGLAASTQ